MNRNFAAMAVVAAVLGMAGAAGAGSSAAGNVERGRTFDPGSYEYRSALETGSLPAEVGDPASGNGLQGAVPTVEIGGRTYRVAIDTP